MVSQSWKNILWLSHVYTAGHALPYTCNRSFRCRSLLQFCSLPLKVVILETMSTAKADTLGKHEQDATLLFHCPLRVY